MGAESVNTVRAALLPGSVNPGRLGASGRRWGWPPGRRLVVAQASDRIVKEQAALRQVATLVAAAAAPEQVFAAVAEEVGRLLQVDYTILSRFEPDRVASVVGS